MIKINIYDKNKYCIVHMLNLLLFSHNLSNNKVNRNKEINCVLFVFL